MDWAARVTRQVLISREVRPRLTAASAAIIVTTMMSSIMLNARLATNRRVLGWVAMGWTLGLMLALAITLQYHFVT